MNKRDRKKLAALKALQPSQDPGKKTGQEQVAAPKGAELSPVPGEKPAQALEAVQVSKEGLVQVSARTSVNITSLKNGGSMVWEADGTQWRLTTKAEYDREKKELLEIHEIERKRDIEEFKDCLKQVAAVNKPVSTSKFLAAMFCSTLMLGGCLQYLHNKDMEPQMKQWSNTNAKLDMVITSMKEVGARPIPFNDVKVSTESISMLKKMQGLLWSMTQKLNAAPAIENKPQSAFKVDAPLIKPISKEKSLSVGVVAVVHKPSGIFVVNPKDKPWKVYRVIQDAGPKEQWKKEEVVDGAKANWATLIPYKGNKVFLQVVGEDFISSIEEFDGGTWYWKPIGTQTGGGIRSQNREDVK